MKKAFTLVEMLIVIGIIGVLVATMAGLFRGSTDKARTVKCMTNLKNLASAVGSSAMSSGHYPYAQSAQYMDTAGSEVAYRTHKGWITYLDNDIEYPIKSPGTFSQVSFASDDEDEISYAITNGAIWQAVGKVRDVYTCPAHVDACLKANHRTPGWSYQMNAYFGYEPDPGDAARTVHDVVKFHSLNRADRILLFAEIQAVAPKASDMQLPKINLSGGNGEKEMDACLVYKTKNGTESIGFNHTIGRDMVGHVAFADGHVEAIFAPKAGNYVDLTDWLCKGSDFTYANGLYQEIKDTDIEQ